MKHLILVLFLLLPGCSLGSVLGPKQLAEVQQHDAEAAAAQAVVDDLVAQAQPIVESAGPALYAGDLQKLAEIQASLQSLDDAIRTAEAQRASAVSAGDAVVRESLEQHRDLFAGLAQGTPVEGLVAGAYAAALLLFRRSRQHLTDAAKNALRLHVSAALLSVGKALGFAHTQTPPKNPQ